MECIKCEFTELKLCRSFNSFELLSWDLETKNASKLKRFTKLTLTMKSYLSSQHICGFVLINLVLSSLM